MLVACVAVGWALLARHGSGNGNDGRVTWKVDQAPFALHVLKGGHELLADATGAAGPGSRLSYMLTDGSNHTLTSLIGSQPVAGGTEYRVRTDEPNRTSTVTVTRTTRSIHVSWRLQPDTGVDTVYTAFHSPAASEHFVGAGIDHTGIDLNGQLVQMKVAYSCARSIVTPFFASTAGYGVYFDTGAVGHMQFRGTHDGMACNDSNSANPLCTMVPGPDRVQACFKTSSLDYDVFVGQPANVVAKYRATAGLMPMPAPAEFGTIKWRDRVNGRGEVTDDIAQFKRLGIPLGSVLVDNPWETNDCWGALQFDSRFGDPATLIRAVHAAGVRFMLWVSPWVTPTAECKPSLDTFGTGTTLLTPQGWNAVDFTNPAAKATYEAKIAALVRLGVDGFKGDRGDETDLESLKFAGGPGRAVNNIFPELFARSVLQASRSAGVASPVTMFRAGYTGTPTAGAGVWSGDQIPNFSGLQDAIHSLASLGASGFALTGSDVGGYATQTGQQILTPEVFARWTQLGAISPIFEVGGADRAAQFWKLGPEAIAAARDSILLHYELFPYLYSLARASSRTGSPILQPLALQYPDDENAWKNDLELLVGPDLLAAPVTSSTRTAHVYLPKGSWVDLFRGETQQGGRTVTRPTPLTDFPLYLRAGATIPFALRAQLWAKPWPLDALSVPGRAGWLSTAGDVTLTGAPRETELLLSRQSPPAHVSVDGKDVPRLPTVGALRAAGTGWVWNVSPFPGALVKVVPHAGTARVHAS
jgi:alpha-glucosidase (family GH31 glycosyl hydrolase)